MIKKPVNKKQGLKIIFLDFDDLKNPLLAAGQARATFEVGKRLVEKGHQVIVISSRYPGYKDRIENGILYKHIGLGSHNIRLNNLIYILALPFSVRRLKADLIIECFTAPISTLFTPCWTKIPVVALPTSFEADRFSKLYHLPFNLIEKMGLRFYRYFLPYTKSLDDRMKKINLKVISKIVPEGVGDEFFRIKQKEPKYILSLGRLDIDQKGLDLLLKSYAKIEKKIRYPLVIAGNGPYENKVKDMISKLHLGKKVKMIGSTYGEKKYKILSEALYVAFPSRHEGFSLFSLEAIASGLPLVGFDIPGLSWAESQVALKAKPFSIDEFASLLEKATNKNLITKMRQECRSFAKKFTWDKVVDQYEDFFFAVLKNEKKFKQTNKSYEN